MTGDTGDRLATANRSQVHDITRGVAMSPVSPALFNVPMGVDSAAKESLPENRVPWEQKTCGDTGDMATPPGFVARNSLFGVANAFGLPGDTGDNGGLHVKLGTQSLSPPAPEPGTERSPAPARAPEPPQLAVRELLSFPLRLVPELPLPTTALCRYRSPGLSAPVVLTTSGEVARRAGKLGALVLTGEELRVLAVAVEQGRASWPMVPRWAERKARQPGWQLSTAELFAGVQEPVRAQGWSTGDVLNLLEIEVLAVAAGVDEGLGLLEVHFGGDARG